MGEEKKAMPGDGIRSMKTSNIFRALNFELYVKPVGVLTIYAKVYQKFIVRLILFCTFRTKLLWA